MEDRGRRARTLALFAAGCLALVGVTVVATLAAVRPPAASPPPAAPAEDLESTVGFAGAWYQAIFRDELEDLAYGAETQFSRATEEAIVRDFFKDRRDGVFVDVGANHPSEENNTYFLEKELGWSGLAVEALEEFAPAYREQRPRTKFVVAFVTDVGGGEETLHVPEWTTLEASGSAAYAGHDGEKPTKPRQVPTATLDGLLAQAGLERVDYLSMDIELGEPKALAGFDIDRYRPALVGIEGHKLVRQQILDYMARHRYVLVGKYLRVDGMNLYFMPLPEAPEAR